MAIYGAIDIGTNSVRLLIGEVNKRRELIPVARGLACTRLGENMWEEPVLTEGAVKRTIAVLQEYKKLLDRYQLSRVKVAATSAVRDSLNRQEFVLRVKNEVGLNVDVITGAEEARLGYEGVLRGSNVQEPFLLLDIGGGSTEFFYYNSKGFVAESIKVGSVRLTGSPLGEDRLLALLEPVAGRAKAAQPGICLVGVGGTITTAVAVKEEMAEYDWQKVHGYRLSRQDIVAIRTRLARLSLEERQKVPGLLPERADVIIAGIDILICAMGALGKEEIVVSEADLLYGLIFAQIGN